MNGVTVGSERGELIRLSKFSSSPGAVQLQIEATAAHDGSLHGHGLIYRNGKIQVARL